MRKGELKVDIDWGPKALQLEYLTFANSTKMYDSVSTLPSSPRALERALELRGWSSSSGFISFRISLVFPPQLTGSLLCPTLATGQTGRGRPLAGWDLAWRVICWCSYSIWMNCQLFFTHNPDLRFWLKTLAALSSAPTWQPGNLFQFSSCFYSNLCSLPSPPGIGICKPAPWYQCTTKGCSNTQQAIDIYTWNFFSSLYWMLD